jgi:hypothetical protein
MMDADLEAIREWVTLPHGEHCVQDVMRLVAWVEDLQKELQRERPDKKQAEFLLQSTYEQWQRRDEAAATPSLKSLTRREAFFQVTPCRSKQRCATADLR